MRPVIYALKSSRTSSCFPGGQFFDRDAGRCPACGKRHIDYVMAHVLGILVSRGLKSGRTPLRDVGSPLIACGFEMFEAPRLGSKSLIVLLDEVDKATAGLIVAEVPEVKGVLKRTGGPLKSVGLSAVKAKPTKCWPAATCARTS
jgi:hypothetical protein